MFDSHLYWTTPSKNKLLGQNGKSKRNLLKYNPSDWKKMLFDLKVCILSWHSINWNAILKRHVANWVFLCEKLFCFYEYGFSVPHCTTRGSESLNLKKNKKVNDHQKIHHIEENECIQSEQNSVVTFFFIYENSTCFLSA